MELKHLSHKSCPSCGSRTITEKQWGQHCNGEWNEQQLFECGCCIEYTPNFSKENIRTECGNTKEANEKKNKRILFKTKLVSYIRRADIDDKFKDDLISRFRYL